MLEEVLVGPIPVGCNKFVLQADAPDPSKIAESVLGVTVVLITCSYHQQEFVRIGYYVNNELPEEFDNNNNNEEAGEERMITNNNDEIPLDKVIRTTLADKPRVTRFKINWNQQQDIMETCMSPPSKDSFAMEHGSTLRLVSPSSQDIMDM